MKYITTDSNSVTFDIYGKVLTFPKGGVYFKINEETITFFCAEQPFNNGYCIISVVADDLKVDGVTYTIEQIRNGAFEYFISVIDTRKYYTKTETHSYVTSRINELVDGAPEALDTLKELADLASNNEELIETLEQNLTNVYTKEEVDEAIENIDLSNFYTKSETYTKEEVDEAIENNVPQIDLSDYYTKDYIDEIEAVAARGLVDLNNRINEIPTVDLTDYYTKEEVDETIDNVDLSDFYTKSETYTKEEVDEAIDNIDLSNFYTKSETYTKEEVDEAIDNVDLSDFYTKSETYTKEEVNALLPTEWVGTQAQYDAIEEKDANTTYYIIEE